MTLSVSNLDHLHPKLRCFQYLLRYRTITSPKTRLSFLLQTHQASAPAPVSGGQEQTSAGSLIASISFSSLMEEAGGGNTIISAALHCVLSHDVALLLGAFLCETSVHGAAAT